MVQNMIKQPHLRNQAACDVESRSLIFFWKQTILDLFFCRQNWTGPAHSSESDGDGDPDYIYCIISESAVDQYIFLTNDEFLNQLGQSILSDQTRTYGWLTWMLLIAG